MNSQSLILVNLFKEHLNDMKKRLKILYSIQKSVIDSWIWCFLPHGFEKSNSNKKSKSLFLVQLVYKLYWVVHMKPRWYIVDGWVWFAIDGCQVWIDSLVCSMISKKLVIWNRKFVIQMSIDFKRSWCRLLFKLTGESSIWLFWFRMSWFGINSHRLGVSIW